MQALPSSEPYQSVSDYFLVDESLDLRGRPLVSGTRETVGMIADMLVDPDTHIVAIIELTDGRRYPIEQIRLHGSEVRLKNHTEAQRSDL